MRVGEACYTCFFEQSKRVLSQCKLSLEEEKRIMRAVEEFLAERYTEEAVPALLGTELHRMLKRLTGCEDPFREAKARANRLAISLVPAAQKIIQRAQDRFGAAVRVALAGNLLDYGVYGASECESRLKRALEEEPAINHIPRLRRLAEEGRRVVYLLDNAGEVVFDKLLIEELKRRGLEVTAVVKSKPIINDATLEDAQQVELTQTCRVITSGGDVVGVEFGEASEELLRAFELADFVIAKGQGHFETLDTYEEKPIAFLLKAKCATVADALRVRQGSSVVLVKNST